MFKNSAIIEKAGISFTGLLTLTFIILKFCNVVNWSWLWVFCPLWLGVLMFVAISIIMVLLIFLGRFIGGTIEFIIKKYGKGAIVKIKQCKHRY